MSENYQVTLNDHFTLKKLKFWIPYIALFWQKNRLEIIQILLQKIEKKKQKNLHLFC